MDGGLARGNGRIGAMLFGGPEQTGFNLTKKRCGLAGPEIITVLVLIITWIASAITVFDGKTKGSRCSGRKKNLWV